jgi:hypothetical protein
MPIAWSTGGTVSSHLPINQCSPNTLPRQLGPIIGGSLSRPAERFPNVFGNNEFLKKYPYFLPCAVPATFTALAWIVTFLFLKETVQSPVPVSRFLGFRKGKADEDLLKVVTSQDPNAIAPAPPTSIKRIPLRSLLTPRVIIAAGNYAFLSLVDIAFRAVQPLFFSTPIHLGGLGLPPSTIGNILSVFGVLNGVFQVFFFAKIHNHWGSKKVFMAGIISAFPAFATFPLINHFARTQGVGAAVWAAVAFQTVVSIGLSLSYGTLCATSMSTIYSYLGTLTGAIFIFISAASPNRASLGATNGLSQVCAALRWLEDQWAD